MPGKMARSDPQTPFGRLEWRQRPAPGSWASSRFRKCLSFTSVQVSSGGSRLRGFVHSGMLPATSEQSEIPTKEREYDAALIDPVHTTSIQLTAIKEMTEICGERKAMIRGCHMPLGQ